jgi:outer membrane lipopolysaccharide assembly protein LptE/RlpB
MRGSKCGGMTSGREAVAAVVRRGKSLRALAALLGCVALCGGGCGYALVGRTSTLPVSIKILQFETLTNQTPRVGVEQRLSREIARELASRGRFRVQPDAAGADAALTGAVTGFDLYAVAFDEQGRAREYQVRITAKVALRAADEKVIWENPSYSFQDNYSFSTSAASYVDRENEAIDRVAERFAESLVSNLLEGF